MEHRKTRWLLAAAPLLFVLSHIAGISAQTTPASAKDAAPILKEKCFQCHGESLQMSKLDLRTREAMLKGGEKGPAIVPGNAQSSLLYKRIAGVEKPVMPMAPLPALTADQIAVI